MEVSWHCTSALSPQIGSRPGPQSLEGALYELCCGLVLNWHPQDGNMRCKPPMRSSASDRCQAGVGQLTSTQHSHVGRSADPPIWCCRCSWPLPCRPSRWCWCAPTGPPAGLTRPMWSMWCFLTFPGTPRSMSGGLGASPEALAALAWSLSWCLAVRCGPEKPIAYQ